MSATIDWDVARRVANRVGGREPFSASYHSASLESDFREFTTQAEALVGATTGLHSLAGPARARVDDIVSDDIAPLGLADGFTIR